MQTLMGNRYGRFRTVELDWSQNSDWSEKSVKLLTDNILSNSVKKMLFNGSLPKDDKTIQKLIYIIDSFQQRIEILRN